MAVYYVVFFDRPTPDYEAGIDFRYICEQAEALDDLADELNLIPLTEFMSLEAELIGLDSQWDEEQGDEDFEEGEEGIESISDIMEDEDALEEWFEPSEGLTTVRGLIKALTEDPSSVPESGNILEELAILEKALISASEKKWRWNAKILD